MDKWSELRTALDVAENGTVSATAAVLGYHRATVIRHIDALEAEIGASIFLRHAQGYMLTEVGEEVLRAARATKDLTDELAGRIRGKTSRVDGEIRVTLLAPISGLIMSAVDAFATQHPECRVIIDASEELVRLEHGEAHVAVRGGRNPDHPEYVVKSLGRAKVSLFAHESYRLRYGLPSRVEEFASHRFVLPRDDDRRLPFWSWVDTHMPPNTIAMMSDDIGVSIEAISRGVGIGFLGEHEAQIRRSLHSVLPDKRAWSVRLWLTTHMTCTVPRRSRR